MNGEIRQSKKDDSRSVSEAHFDQRIVTPFAREHRVHAAILADPFFMERREIRGRLLVRRDRDGRTHQF